MNRSAVMVTRRGGLALAATRRVVMPSMADSRSLRVSSLVGILASTFSLSRKPGCTHSRTTGALSSPSSFAPNMGSVDPSRFSLQSSTMAIRSARHRVVFSPLVVGLQVGQLKLMLHSPALALQTASQSRRTPSRFDTAFVLQQDEMTCSGPEHAEVHCRITDRAAGKARARGQGQGRSPKYGNQPRARARAWRLELQDATRKHG